MSATMGTHSAVLVGVLQGRRGSFGLRASGRLTLTTVRQDTLLTPTRQELDVAGIALVAGSVATAIFMLSQLPMLIKAGRTKDLASFSPLNIVLSNIGNVIYAVYVFNLPPGPIWAMHAFYLTATGLMLFWYLRHRTGRSQGNSARHSDALLESD
jgi:uncharacterized protein with PQ loop repeat